MGRGIAPSVQSECERHQPGSGHLLCVKSALGLSHDETQPGAPQHSAARRRHWSLHLLLPPRPIRSQKTLRRRNTNPRNPSSSSPPSLLSLSPGFVLRSGHVGITGGSKQQLVNVHVFQIVLEPPRCRDSTVTSRRSQSALIF